MHTPSRPALLPIACILGLVFTVIALSDPPHEEAKKSTPTKKVVFIAGKASHAKGQHEHKAGSLLLADHLNKSGLPIQAVVTTEGWPQDESILADAAAVIIYADGGPGHPAITHLETLREMAKKGVGIGCIHYAVEVPKDQAGEAFLDLLGGYFEANWSVNPHWEASFKLPEHPISQGIADYKITDEWYYHMRFRPDQVGLTPILADLPPPSSLSRPDGAHSGNPDVRAAVLERKEPQTLMWAYQRPDSLGKGRSFGFTGGHFHKNWQVDSQRRVVLNAIAWIANLKIPTTGTPSPTPSETEMLANLDTKP